MYAVIMAGGRGTRFWPRSREKKPKHLLDIISEKTIIQETVDRIKPLITPEQYFGGDGEKTCPRFDETASGNSIPKHYY